MRFVQFVLRLGVPLTRAQRVLACVAFDGVEPQDLGEEDRTVAEKLFGPVDVIPSHARSILVAVLGARAGKSYIFCGLYSLWRALFADLSTLAPGEVAVALIVAPDLRLGRQTLRYVRGAAETNPELAPLLVAPSSSDSLTIRRPDGHLVSVECLPASRGGSALRGRTLVCAVLDECAFFRDENSVINDVDLFRAVAPRVLPGGLVILASTPWLEQGLLFEFFTKNFGTPANAMAAHGPTLLMLPSRRNAEAVAREEESAAQFFGADILKECTIDEEPWGELALGWAATVGGDIGLVKDSSSFLAVHKNITSGIVRASDFVELRPRKGAPLRLSDFVATAAEFAGRHKSKRIWVDHHVLQPAREHLPAGLHLQPVPGGQEAKAARFIVVRQAIKEGRLVIPKRFTRLRAQLADVYSKPLPGGGVQIFQRRKEGAHGDIASAFILAAWAALKTTTATYTPREKRELKDDFCGGEKARRLSGF
jgi:hypothetical protein